LGKASGPCTNHRRIPRDLLGALHGIHQAVDRLRREKYPRNTILYRIQDAAPTICNYGATACLYLHGNDTKVFLSGEDKRTAPPEVVPQHFSRLMTEKAHV